MLLFLLAGAVTLVTIGLLVAATLRETHETETRSAREAAIYKDQLAEVDVDLARGVLSEEQAAAARNEIERRLLAALRREEDEHVKRKRTAQLGGVIAAAALPLIAGGIYLSLGRPDLPAQPFAERRDLVEARQAAAMPAGTHSELRDRISGLEERIAATPGNLEDQALLARSYAQLGNYDKALSAYTVANRLAEGRDRRLAGEMAEVLTLQNQGIVPQEAVDIFRRINEDFPDDPQSRYYLGLHSAQIGDEETALATLIALRADSPLDAPWMPAVNELLAQLGAPQPEPAPAERGPSAEEMAAIRAMSPEEQDEMIRGMVDGLAARLEENPDNVEGWRRLARAYEVLGETDNARNAHTEVITREPDDPAANAFLRNEEEPAQ